MIKQHFPDFIIRRQRNFSYTKSYGAFRWHSICNVLSTYVSDTWKLKGMIKWLSNCALFVYSYVHYFSFPGTTLSLYWPQTDNKVVLWCQLVIETHISCAWRISATQNHWNQILTYVWNNHTLYMHFWKH